MSRKRVGKLPLRYCFALNPYPNERISQCPKCCKRMHSRKFPLLIYVQEWGWLILGKTCNYCAKCEFIVAHKHELEAELTEAFTKMRPDVIGNDYMVIGTVDRKHWKQGMEGNVTKDSMLDHAADFKSVGDLVIEPAHWSSGPE